MAEHLREIARIADDRAPPTFDNTILALERSGRTLDRVAAVYGVWDGNRSSPELRAVSKVMAPRMAAHGDAVSQNAKLFARIDAVYADRARLNPEQQRLTWVYWNRFVRAGARLSPEGKAQLSRYNQELAGLYNTFGANELSDEETYALVLDSPAQLKGLPASETAAAAAEAQRRGQPGKWVIANTRSSMEPFLTYADDRALREKGWRMWIMRGDNGDAHDNNATVVRILQLRAAKAKLLGYPTFAHYRLADAMAKTPDAAMGLMLAVWAPAKAAVRQDVADMQVIADAQAKAEARAPQKIEAWDYRYYAEKLRKAKYDLDLNEIKPYLQLQHVREAMFWAAGQVYGFQFKPVTGFAVFDPAMSVYEVTRDGRHVGYWYFDPYARPGKRSGAWMNAYQEQHKLDGGQATIVSNNANFVGGAPGQPVLIGWDDARTMFHEFGHALHGLNSDVTYPTLSGTAVQRDYVEFPSQLNEHFLTTPQVLRFLVNKKGEHIPDALLAKIERAHTFNQGFATVEAQESAIVDMKLHLAGDAVIEPHAFEKQTLAELDAPPEVVMRHRIPQFGHVFQGEGYAAGYYGYLWAEGAGPGRVGGVRGGREQLRPRRRQAPAGRHHERRQHGGARPAVPQLPRPRPQGGRPVARPRLSRARRVVGAGGCGARGAVTDGPDPVPARAARSDAAPADGGRRTVTVAPDEVWSAPGAVAEPPTRAALAQEARRAFFGPIWLVVGLSAALLTAFMLVLALIATLHR